MFKWVRRIVCFILCVLLACIAIVFTLENSQQYSPAFFGLYLFPLSAGLWMILMLFMPATLGALLGVIVSLIPVYFGRYSVASKEKRIKHLENLLLTERSVLQQSALKESALRE